MGNGRSSGLPKGVKNRTLSLKDRISNLVVRAQATGYTLKTNYIDTTARAEAVDTYFAELDSYTAALGIPNLSNDVTGTLSVYKFPSKSTLGDASPEGDIRMAFKYIEDLDDMRDTLPHEYTHQLVNYLITKELGYAKNSREYNSAYHNADIYKMINTKALADFQDYLRSQGKEDLAVKIDTPYKAAKQSDMRDYATRDYGWAPKGAGIEIPTVAAENFVKVRYDWNKLKQRHAYSYFVLKELARLVNK